MQKPLAATCFQDSKGKVTDQPVFGLSSNIHTFIIGYLINTVQKFFLRN